MFCILALVNLIYFIYIKFRECEKIIGLVIYGASGETEDVPKAPVNEILLAFSSSQSWLLSVYLILELSSLLDTK